MRAFAIFLTFLVTCSVATAQWVPLHEWQPREEHRNDSLIPQAAEPRVTPRSSFDADVRGPVNGLTQNARRQETGALQERFQPPDAATTLQLQKLSKMADQIQRELNNRAQTAQPHAREAFPSASQVRRNSLTIREIQYAATAWNYFKAATNPETGLVRSTLKFPSTTMWDQGGYLLALVSAQRLGLISRPEAVYRARKAVESLGQIALVNGRFPNKAYNTQTLAMTDYANRPTPNGIGYSALDIMRLVSGMIALEHAYPEVRAFSQEVRGRWPLSDLVSGGRFWSTTSVGLAANTPLQEGRIGYEQYAGRVGVAAGLSTQETLMFEPIVRWHVHNGIPIPGDVRDATTHGVDAVTTSEPFLLEAMEFGWRPDLREVALGVYVAQVNRFVTTGQITALSEDHIAGPPYFAYDGVLVGSRPFESVTPVRAVVNHKRRISTKAAFGWWALVPNEYGEVLISTVEALQTPDGWQAGLFEVDNTPNTIVTLNTNAVVLEALHFKALGPIVQTIP